MNYKNMTAPCGLPCFVCFLYLGRDDESIREMVSKEVGIPADKAISEGCRNEDGKPDHMDIECRLYPCTKSKEVEFCCDCEDFPCDLLQPYLDRANLWHNTKVYHLCLIKKMGLESWARDKAKSVVQSHMLDEWKL